MLPIACSNLRQLFSFSFYFPNTLISPGGVISMIQHCLSSFWSVILSDILAPIALSHWYIKVHSHFPLPRVVYDNSLYSSHSIQCTISTLFFFLRLYLRYIKMSRLLKAYLSKPLRLFHTFCTAHNSQFCQCDIIIIITNIICYLTNKSRHIPILFLNSPNPFKFSGQVGKMGTK